MIHRIFITNEERRVKFLEAQFAKVPIDHCIVMESTHVQITIYSFLSTVNRLFIRVIGLISEVRGTQ